MNTSNNRPFLTAIVGGSGSGKSWLAERLHAALGESSARISLDDFYLDRSHVPPEVRANLNFDDPEAIDWIALEVVLRDLLAGRAGAPYFTEVPSTCR